MVQCDILYRRGHARGSARTLCEKFCSGLLLFVLLLVIIFGPLLLFSTANPVSQSNPVASASIAVSLVGQQGEYPLIDISSFVLAPIDDTLYTQLRNEDLIEDSDHEDSIQRVSMAPFSDAIWSISPPSLESLTTSLNDPSRAMSLKFEYAFTRTSGPSTNKVISSQVLVQLDQSTQSTIAQLINRTASDATEAGVRSPLQEARSARAAAIHAYHYHTPSSVSRVSVGPSAFGDGLLRASSNDSVSIAQVVPVVLRLPATSDPIELDQQTNRANITLTLDVAHQGPQTPIGHKQSTHDTARACESIIVSAIR